MSEYCEYMWDPTRGHGSTQLARSIYQEEARLEAKDKKLAIKTVRAILREMPGVDLKQCNDEYITRFLLARKFRTEQAAALIGAYQAQVAHRQDIFGNLTARDPRLQRALRAGIPGVLPARDKKGRCILVILASQWDPIAVPALSVQRAIFLVLETLIQDPRNQQCGFVAVVDWGGFTLRQGGALGAAAVRNLITALRGRYPARFKAIHFLLAPLYVQATLALVKPFLDEKTRHKIYLHGNNLSTLHEHLPTDILPAELGGTGPSFNPGLWAEPVIHSAMKEAELAAMSKEKNSAEKRDEINDAQNGNAVTEVTRQKKNENENKNKNDENKNKTENYENKNKTKNDENKNSETPLIEPRNKTIENENQRNFENRRINLKEDKKIIIESEREMILDNSVKICHDRKNDRIGSESDIECIELSSETNSNEFEMVSNNIESEDSRDNSLDSLKIDKVKLNNEKLPEETHLIT